MSAVLCIFGIHKWGPWINRGETRTERTWYNDGSDGYGIIYDGPYLSEIPLVDHTCERCGRTKKRAHKGEGE